MNYDEFFDYMIEDPLINWLKLVETGRVVGKGPRTYLDYKWERPYEC
jgi:hypothetical protein